MNINFNLSSCLVDIFDFETPLRQINAELVKFLLYILNIFLDIDLVVVKLKQTKLGEIGNHVLQFFVKLDHSLSYRVFFVKNLFPHRIKGLVVNLEQIFDAFLLFRHFVDKSGLFNFIVLFQLRDTTLNIFDYFT